ncbi:NepR family anti-sigma factor [Enterovirga sp.]|nr:NepR family anti-sigma factor [Enterovirga sp.]
MYGELIEQPVPDRLTAILARIGAPGRESGS